MAETRIEWLIKVAHGLNDSQNIVAAIHNESGGLENFEQSLRGRDGRCPIWKFLDGEKAECVNHVRLIAAAVAMIGIDGGEVGFVYPVTTPQTCGYQSSAASNRRRGGGNWRFTSCQGQNNSVLAFMAGYKKYCTAAPSFFSSVAMFTKR